MSAWRVNAGGTERTVTMESQMFGKKIISVDGVELKRVGLPISMWANYRFDLDGNPAMIKFRAVKRMRGMSLFVNGEKVTPEPGTGMSAEAVQWFVAPVLLFFLLIIVGLLGLPLLAIFFR